MSYVVGMSSFYFLSCLEAPITIMSRHPPHRGREHQMRSILKQEGLCSSSYHQDGSSYHHTTAFKRSIRMMDRKGSGSVHFRDELIRYTFDSLANELISVRLAPLATP